MKLFFIDVETTGTNPLQNGIIQLSGIIEVDGDVIEEIDLKIKPYPDDIILDSALEVNGITRVELEDYPNPSEVYRKLTGFMSKYVDKFNRSDKFHFVGYNARFDDDFIRAWFKKCGDNYYGSFFFWPPIDVANIAAIKLMPERSKMENFKLVTVVKHSGIDIDESKLHDALYDIRLTRELFHILREKK